MADIFSNILKSSETIFKNEIALDPEFIPKKIPFRESESDYMATCIKPLFYKRTGKNLIINGPSGIGKTLAAKNILKELEERTDDIFPVYVNCWKKNTTYQIVLEICKSIDYKFTQNKRTDELIAIIAERLNKKCSAFVLDEVDKIQELDILYNLAESLYRKSILLITNEKEWLVKLDSRIKSRLVPEQLEFRPYTLEETNEILKQRVEYAFHPGVIEESYVKKVAEKAFLASDIRLGLYLLKESAEIAESASSKKIEIKHIDQAIGKMGDFKKPVELDKDEKHLLDIINMNPDKTTGEIFRIFKEKNGKSERTFQRKMKSLEKSKFIEVDEIENNLKGRSFKIKKLTEF